MNCNGHIVNHNVRFIQALLGLSGVLILLILVNTVERNLILEYLPSTDNFTIDRLKPHLQIYWLYRLSAITLPPPTPMVAGYSTRYKKAAPSQMNEHIQ